MKTNYTGIDYAAGQPVNRDLETGIRYGIIHSNKLNQDTVGDIYQNGKDLDFEAYQAQARQALRNALRDYFSERSNGTHKGSELDEAVESAFDAVSDGLGEDYQSGGDCTRMEHETDGLKLMIDSSGDLWVLQSPYFTYAQFCSPCAPGACYLSNPLETPDEANKCYCLPSDWFDEYSPLPYAVYSVATGEKI